MTVKHRISYDQYLFIFPLLSAPEIPLIDSVETGTKDATVFLFPMEDQEQITFSVEYLPLSNVTNAEQKSGRMKTNETAISLTDLESDTMYDIRIYSVFERVTSVLPAKTKFRTKKLTVDNVDATNIDEHNKTGEN